MSKKLTDRFLTQTAAPKHQARFVFDALTTGLGVKFTPKGKKLFVCQLRYPGHATQTTRTLGAYPGLTLQAARAKATEWYNLARAGIDPSLEEQKQVAAAHRAAVLAQRNTFAAVAEAFIAEGLNGQRQRERVINRIRRELVPHWGDKLISEITRFDVADLVENIVRRSETGAGAYARNVLQTIKSIFAWAIERDYGLEVAPTDRIRTERLCGAKRIRIRVLTNDELRRVWAATSRMDGPYPAMIKLLLLTGCRLQEVAGARWSEFDFANNLWKIPAARFKQNEDHVVPLVPDMVAVLQAIPRRGDYVFSFTHGRTPLQGFAKLKKRLDALIGEIEPWSTHDLRRTVRTRLSELRIPENIAEMCIGHSKKGLLRIYDQHRFADEIRAALEAWARLLRSIVEPSGADNVVALRA